MFHVLALGSEEAPLVAIVGEGARDLVETPAALAALAAVRPLAGQTVQLLSEDTRWLLITAVDEPEPAWAPLRAMASALADDLADEGSLPSSQGSSRASSRAGPPGATTPSSDPSSNEATHRRPRRTLVRTIQEPKGAAPATLAVPDAYLDARFPDGREATPVEHARALFALGRLEAARARLEAHLVQHPSSGSAHFQLGLVLRRLDLPALALTHLEAAAAAAPDEPVVLEKLGRVLLELERAAEAEEIFANLLRLEDTRARRLDLAEALVVLGAPASAEPLVAEALAADIDDPLALALLALVRASAGAPDEARALAHEAQRLLSRRRHLRSRVEPVLGRVRGVLS